MLIPFHRRVPSPTGTSVFATYGGLVTSSTFGFGPQVNGSGPTSPVQMSAASMGRPYRQSAPAGWSGDAASHEEMSRKELGDQSTKSMRLARVRETGVGRPFRPCPTSLESPPALGMIW
jgi:hypothetical protein